jgi:hypothetical protein
VLRAVVLRRGAQSQVTKGCHADSKCRGSWPAEEYAAAQRAQGTDAQVVMDLPTDQFLVVTSTTTQ